jgi:hypothetical protein
MHCDYRDRTNAPDIPVHSQCASDQARALNQRNQPDWDVEWVTPTPVVRVLYGSAPMDFADVHLLDQEVFWVWCPPQEPGCVKAIVSAVSADQVSGQELAQMTLADTAPLQTPGDVA